MWVRRHRHPRGTRRAIELFLREMPEVSKLWTRVATPADCIDQRNHSDLAVDHRFDPRLARAESSVLRGNLGGVIDQARTLPVACDDLALVSRCVAAARNIGIGSDLGVGLAQFAPTPCRARPRGGHGGFGLRELGFSQEVELFSGRHADLRCRAVWDPIGPATI